MCFFVFAYDKYYPSGGMGDYVGSYPTLTDAITAANNAMVGNATVGSRDYADVATVKDDQLVLVHEEKR